MRKIAHIAFLVVLCYSSVMTQAQATRWTYAGGETLGDEATGIVASTDDGFVACIYGGVTDSITFSVIKVDQYGNLVWFTEIDKNDAVEVPHTIMYNHDSTSYIISATVDSAIHPWIVEIDDLTGNILASSDDWSDLVADSSGFATHVILISDSIIIAAGNHPDSIYLFIMGDTPADLAEWFAYILPASPYSNDLAITDMQSGTETFFISVNTTPESPTPYLFEFDFFGNLLDQYAFPEDSILVTAMDIKLSGMVATGYYNDSTSVYFARFDTTGGLHVAIDTLFPAPGYKVIGTDILKLDAGTSLITATHFEPGNVHTVLMQIDVDGNIISETPVLTNAGAISLTKMDLMGGIFTRLALAGRINTSPDDNKNEFLIIRTDGAGNFPECVYDCVWPGDANNDQIVTMEDLLAIGIGYDLGGPERDSINNFWVGHISEAWEDSLPSGLNAKYTNCNGDSLINENDMPAILNNYGLNHTIFSFREMGGGNYPLWLNTAGIIIDTGYNEIPIMLGSEEIPVDDIYGLEFTIAYEGPAIIDSTTVQIKFNDSWLGDAEINLLQLDKNFPTVHMIDGGVTRKDLNNSSGYGEIGRVSFVVEDNIAGISWGSGDSIIIFNISGATGILNTMEPVMLDASSYSALIAGIDDNIQDQDLLHIFPNPFTNNTLHIISNHSGGYKIWSLSDITGKLIAQGYVHNNMVLLDPHIELAPGEYFLTLMDDTSVIQTAIIKME
ncbi:MAG: T9SS type A sorting domain-containing protein [Chitinophagales bacterium]|nr:T9SS type A sorting domain-containing protein [Chitinophagales bacterium]